MSIISEKSTPLYMDAELWPNRSMSQASFTYVMICIGLISLTSSLVFLKIGAFPIVGFFGLDVLGLWFAFRLCFREQKQHTRVRITADHLRVDHVDPKGRKSNVELPTAFTRVELKEPLTPNSWLTLASRREAYVIGRFLTVDERKALADAIRSALMKARSERYPGEIG